MKQYPGYTLVKHEDCPEQHGTLTVLTHDVSGAAVLLVENDDDNKAFGIGFGTFPSDDTGVFHILEHSVLAGSEKYPVKSPFLQLLKSSMASFLNAMTFPDKTVYPFATPNETDFKNLMDVYLNAVFCPLAMVDKGVFEQEGWQLREVTHDLHADGPVGVMTDYEAKFYDQGITINRCVAVKTEDTKCDLYPGMSTDCAPV